MPRRGPECQTLPPAFSGMFHRDDALVLSATDLSNFLGCRHRTALDMAVAAGSREKPAQKPDALLDVLRQRGDDHERAYVQSLRGQGLQVVELAHLDSLRQPDELVAATVHAMRTGAQIIVQGGLRDGQWFGKPDVLRRIEVASKLGGWSYEVIDTKLARETKAGTILQLGLYSAMVGQVQGDPAEWFYVVTPDKEQPVHVFRFDEYAAYFRMVRRQLSQSVRLDPALFAAAHYPEPVPHCTICRWNGDCAERRVQDDHLSLIAGISRLHRRELESREILTLAGLAQTPLPLAFEPKRGSIETYVKMREQARLQFESRGQAVPRFELRKIVETKDEGLCRLPEPSPGDVFLDLEGAPYAAEGGREYLFGVVTVRQDGTPEYHAFWGMTEREERAAFEQVMDLILARWDEDPAMHVYHYAPYETTAFKKLAQRYVTREKGLDSLLKNGRFVDLYAVVHQGLFVGVDSYSIKRLEDVYGFTRAVKLIDANDCRQRLERALDLNCLDLATKEIVEAVRGYNEDDCVSTLRLREWLEKVRQDHIAKGWEIPRPVTPLVEEDKLNPHEERVAELRPKLLKGIPDNPKERDAEQKARWLLAYLLDYHRREDKASFWEYYRLNEMPEDELFDEPDAIAGMEFVARMHENTNKKTGKPTGVVTDRYRFPAQELEIKNGATLKLREGGTFGKAAAVDRVAFTIDVEKQKAHRDLHPKSVFAYEFVNSKAQEDSLVGIAERVIADGGVTLGAKAHDRAARTLLLSAAPALSNGKLGVPHTDIVAHLTEAALRLDHSVLPVQGPPGAGKTYSGAEAICALVAEGKKVGVTAQSHKVIRKLLEEVLKAAKRKKMKVRIGQKASEEDVDANGDIALTDSNDDALRMLADGEVQVFGGTAWLWARADLAKSVDLLFVDEAGQMALANVIAMSPAASSIVLLGDPQQLEQVKKASHPDGVSAAALEHVLGDAKTIPNDRGVFLPMTWRMSPTLTAFTSELFYEKRLESKPGLEKQRLNGAGDLDGSGLWMVPSEHDGNRAYSMEEVDAVADLVKRLTAKGVTWTNEHGHATQLEASDILIVSPYNAQVSRLIDKLAGTGARVGTVDKFQGQEAPVVIYSMATSRPEDAPRGMEFLYSLNRLNVATSRAKCAAIVVASQRLFEPECRTPRQMKLANALCRYRELSSVGAA